MNHELSAVSYQISAVSRQALERFPDYANVKIARGGSGFDESTMSEWAYSTWGGLKADG
jgi:hypothetical protein